MNENVFFFSNLWKIVIKNKESLNSMRFRFYIYVECNNNLVSCICMMAFHPPSFIHMLITFFLSTKVFLLLVTSPLFYRLERQSLLIFFFLRLNDGWWNLYCCNHMCPVCVLYSSIYFSVEDPIFCLTSAQW